MRSFGLWFGEWAASLYSFSFQSLPVPPFRRLSPPFSVLICTALLAALLCVPAFAQEKPDAPKPKPKPDRKVFTAGVSLLAAAKAADVITKRQLLDRGGVELNPIFGSHPSPGKQAGINLGIFAAQSFAFYLTERNKHAWIRWTGRALLAHAVVEHTQLAACNAGIDPSSPVIRHCNSFVPF